MDYESSPLSQEEYDESMEYLNGLKNEIALRKSEILGHELTKKSLSETEKKTYQNIIVALLDYIKGDVPQVEKHQSFTSEADMIASIEKHFKSYQGLSETTLKRKFAEVKKSFNEQ